MDEPELIVDPDGGIRFIHNDDVADLFTAQERRTSRASHVEPDDSGGWTADMSPVNGPVLGPFARRQEALDAEVTWLRSAMVAGLV